MANYVSYENLSAVVTKISNKFKTLEGAYVIKGSKTFANLPLIESITASMIGYVYNISEEFTTTADFVEGAGKKYAAGTNVVIVDNAEAGAAVPDFKFDVISTFVDVDSITTTVETVSDMIAVDEFDETQSYAIGDVVKYENTLYKFKTAHVADDPWDADPTKVEAVDILTLINAAEPDSLTTPQLNEVLDLLD